MKARHFSLANTLVDVIHRRFTKDRPNMVMVEQSGKKCFFNINILPSANHAPTTLLSINGLCYQVLLSIVSF